MKKLPANADFPQRVLKTLRRLPEGLLPVKDRRLLVAVSGGADSVALLRVLHQLGYACEVAHCNFHLRGEASDRDAAFVRNLCRDLGVPFHLRDFATETFARSQAVSVEMAARDLRYQWFDQLLAERNLSAVAVAHHKEDNVETFFLHLARGSGLHGLGGMRDQRGKIIRPLLDVSRREIEAWLSAIGQPFVTDETNADVRFKRNRLRNRILPELRQLNPAFDDTLLQTMRRLREADDYLNQVLDDLWTDFTSALPIGLALDCRRAKAHSLFRTLLHKQLTPLGFNADEIADALCRSEVRTGACWVGEDYTADYNRGYLEITPPVPDFIRRSLEVGEIELPEQAHLSVRTYQLSIPPALDKTTLRFSGREGDAEDETTVTIDLRNTHEICLDLDELQGLCYIRRAQVGDSFRPFGLQGRKLVSDLQTSLKISPARRKRTLVVGDDSGLLWVVGLRRAAGAPITAKTKRLLRLTFTPPMSPL